MEALVPIEQCKDTYQIVNVYSLRWNWDYFLIELLSPDGSDSKKSAYSVGKPDSIPGLGRSPGEGNGNLLQYSCLENPMDRGASDQISLSVVSHSLRPHESQHTRPPCPSPTPRVHSDSRPSSQ